MSIKIEFAMEHIGKLVISKLNFPPEVGGMRKLGETLAKHAKSENHATAVVNSWIEQWPQWPKPSEVVDLCGLIADPVAVDRSASPACEYCDGTGWEERDFVLQHGIFAGESVTAVTRCRCGGSPPVPRTDANYVSRQGGLRMRDSEILDWLQEQIVDVIYLDDGRIIDVRGGSLRKTIELFVERNRKESAA